MIPAIKIIGHNNKFNKFSTLRRVLLRASQKKQANKHKLEILYSSYSAFPELIFLNIPTTSVDFWDRIYKWGNLKSTFQKS